MSEVYLRWVDLTPKQAWRLGEILTLHLEIGGVCVQQTEAGKLLVTNLDSGDQWKIGVRGGSS